MAVIVGPDTGAQRRQQAMAALEYFMTSQQRKKELEAQQAAEAEKMRQQQAQFDASIAEQKRRNDAGILSDTAAAGHSGALTDATKFKTLDDQAAPIADGFIKNAQTYFPGNPAGQAKYIGEYVNANIKDENLAERVRQRASFLLANRTPGVVDSTEVENAAWKNARAKGANSATPTPLDVAATSQMSIGAQPNQTAMEDVQLRGLGEGYGKALNVVGKLAPDANQLDQSKTNITTTGMQIGAQERIAAANRDAVSKAGSSTRGSSATGQSPADAYRDKQQAGTAATASELLPQVDYSTVGLMAKASSKIPQTPAYNFSVALDELKSKIAFGALAEMRAASKTGGALGNVSDTEIKLLSSTLGSLDQGQSPEQFRSTLAKIIESTERFEAAKLKYGSGDGGGYVETATNPQTGQRIGRRTPGGQWEPIR